MLGRLFNLALRMVLGVNFKDTQCGFKAFRRSAAELVFTQQQIETWGFDPELLYLAKKAGLRIVEIPVYWAHSEDAACIRCAMVYACSRNFFRFAGTRSRVSIIRGPQFTSRRRPRISVFSTTGAVRPAVVPVFP